MLSSSWPPQVIMLDSSFEKNKNRYIGGGCWGFTTVPETKTI